MSLLAFKLNVRLHLTEREVNVSIDALHNSQGQLGGNLCKKVTMEYFTSFSSTTMRYRVCHNLTATVSKNKITFFTSVSLDVICKCHTCKTFFF